VALSADGSTPSSAYRSKRGSVWRATDGKSATAHPRFTTRCANRPDPAERATRSYSRR
jgi:hypothetical protein